MHTTMIIIINIKVDIKMVTKMNTTWRGKCDSSRLRNRSSAHPNGFTDPDKRRGDSDNEEREAGGADADRGREGNRTDGLNGAQAE